MNKITLTFCFLLLASSVIAIPGIESFNAAPDLGIEHSTYKLIEAIHIGSEDEPVKIEFLVNKETPNKIHITAIGQEAVVDYEGYSEPESFDEEFTYTFSESSVINSIKGYRGIIVADVTESRDSGPKRVLYQFLLNSNTHPTSLDVIEGATLNPNIEYMARLEKALLKFFVVRNKKPERNAFLVLNED